MHQRLIWNFEFTEAKTQTAPKLSDVTDEIKWEVRFFWPKDHIIRLHALDPGLLLISNYKLKFRQDVYHLLPPYDYNLKHQDGILIYKPLIKQTEQATGFGPKIDLSIPDTINQLDIATSLQLQQIMQEGKRISIHKEAYSYKFPSNPGIKLELAKLTLEEMQFHSLCIEGKSLALVQTIREHLLDEPVSSDYVAFLKTLI